MTTELKNQEKMDSPVVENITQDSQEFTTPAPIDIPEEAPSAQPAGEHVEPEVSSEVAEAGVTAISESTHATAAAQNLSDTGVTVNHEFHPPVEDSGLITFPVTSAKPEYQILHRPNLGSTSESGNWKSLSAWVNKLRTMFQKGNTAGNSTQGTSAPLTPTETRTPADITQTQNQTPEIKKAA